MELEEEIYDFIETRSGGVTFVEIANQFGKGKYMLLCDRDNVVFCSGLSSPVVNALTNLMITEKRVLGIPTTVIVYAMDGGVLQLPIVKHVPKERYKELHWLPLVLWTVTQAKQILNDKDRAMYREAGYDV